MNDFFIAVLTGARITTYLETLRTICKAWQIPKLDRANHCASVMVSGGGPRNEHASESFAAQITESLDLSPRMHDIARALLLPLGRDGVLKREVKALLESHNMQASYDRYREPEWIVTTALYKRIHRATNILTVQELAAEVDEVLAKAGETYTPSPRKVGEILRSLGFQTERLGNRGRGLRISRPLLRQIHKNAKVMGVCRADILGPEV